jgi:hypothetical protein
LSLAAPRILAAFESVIATGHPNECCSEEPTSQAETEAKETTEVSHSFIYYEGKKGNCTACTVVNVNFVAIGNSAGRHGARIRSKTVTYLSLMRAKTAAFHST